MPKWRTHIKYAKRLGVSSYISNLTYKVIIQPKENGEFIEFCEEKSAYSLELGISLTKVVAHRFAALGNKTAFHTQWSFLEQKGEDYRKAWLLHLFLDYLKRTVFGVEETWKRFHSGKVPSRTCEDSGKIFEDVEHFVKENKEEIEKDLNIGSR